MTLVLDDAEVEVKTAKSFWTTCGELIKKEIGDYAKRHSLKPGDRVWLRVVERGSKFAVERT